MTRRLTDSERLDRILEALERNQSRWADHSEGGDWTALLPGPDRPPEPPVIVQPTGAVLRTTIDDVTPISVVLPDWHNQLYVQTQWGMGSRLTVWFNDPGPTVTAQTLTADRSNYGDWDVPAGGRRTFPFAFKQFWYAAHPSAIPRAQLKAYRVPNPDRRDVIVQELRQLGNARGMLTGATLTDDPTDNEGTFEVSSSNVVLFVSYTPNDDDRLELTIEIGDPVNGTDFLLGKRVADTWVAESVQVVPITETLVTIQLGAIAGFLKVGASYNTNGGTAGKLTLVGASFAP